MPNPVPQSPNVAGLGKYGDYQVSHFTGIPDISIPIFEAKSGSLSVPIALSYHASGVKPTDVGSWVGMGWSLSAGGQVARNVQGKPDEDTYYASSRSGARCVTKEIEQTVLFPCCMKDGSRPTTNAFQREFVNRSLVLVLQSTGIERKRKGGMKPSGKCKGAE